VLDVGVHVDQFFAFPHGGDKHARHGFGAVGAVRGDRAQHILTFLEAEQVAFAAESVHEEVPYAIFNLEVNNRAEGLVVHAAVIVEWGNQFCDKVLKIMSHMFFLLFVFSKLRGHVLRGRFPCPRELHRFTDSSV